ncbi:YgjP-like metallopeptidase domain-containing protein [uncultured Brachyspira sp.]
MEANHSRKFYDVVSLYMPEWKKHKKILDTFFNDL